MSAPDLPPSPGVGARRKGPRTLPRLPLSAFSPPNSGTSDRFPLPASPSTVHPESIVDAHVVSSEGNLDQWTAEAGKELGGRIGGVVLVIKNETNLEQAVASLSKSNVPITSLVVPYPLQSGVPTNPSSLLKSSPIPIALSTLFKGPSPSHQEGIKWALSQGHVVHLDVGLDLHSNAGDEPWEVLEEFVGNSVGAPGSGAKGAIVLSNILPPSHTYNIPIVKLLNHPTYLAYQAHLASLSLIPLTYIDFLPPDWDTPTPPTPPPHGSILSPAMSPMTPGGTVDDKFQDSKEKREWKRRIKMYLGPAVEAFGLERIIFGSSPSAFSKSKSRAGDWYELARESLAELGIEQEGIDAVFRNNAIKVYSS
ncbi:hypothetical protein SISNIDRAFT_481000 [Sistotremastrum niveocremeum HHB9708]|uniref:Amidohydrolase-related domain-containing protein n=1 Tax=Sistotremastrum niveocremeum HHB9708 TaxID=1314777 RepID=A0A164ZYG7_9AGAM|nr:hypothetical protein SISNIDRAFT_481000 [Sistotremastrum niveocremeum HHB9708]